MQSKRNVELLRKKNGGGGGGHKFWYFILGKLLDTPGVS